jgi:hypothetical protein
MLIKQVFHGRIFMSLLFIYLVLVFLHQFKSMRKCFINVIKVIHLFQFIVSKIKTKIVILMKMKMQISIFVHLIQMINLNV